MPDFIWIRSTKFPILDGEDQELINPGTYGKSFAEFSRDQLSRNGFECPGICCEDWGWWVEISLPENNIGLCCYRHPDKNGIESEFACCPSPESTRVWSWRKFRKVDIGDQVDRIYSVLENAFEQEPEIETLGRTEELPF